MASEKLHIILEPKSIPACTGLPPELAFMNQALQHQVDVFEQSRDHDIILDLAPTGTGKTKAGLTVLLHQPSQSAIYIAPTNALVHQQKEAAEKFVQEAGLNHFVISASAKEVREWSNDQVGSRPGEKIYNFLRNPATLFPEIGANRPVLLVTNPDLFYYATFFAYNKLDRVNIASGFYTKFATVIFDEFHLYDAKQLVGLLFYLAHSHVFHFFENGRRVVLLTATPEKACEDALMSLRDRGVRIARIDGESSSTYLQPSQTSVKLEFRPQLDKDPFLAELLDEVVRRFQTYPDQYGAVILDSLDLINRLYSLLQARGLGPQIGRITGPSPQADRKRAMQCPIILATSTVDVGFNFERNPTSNRQSLDWLLFSARDYAAFWQRIGRVGRVLGRTKTDIPSEAIAYLSEIAWEQGLGSLDCSGGRKALEQKLSKLACLERPFLRIYWQSEAFLEIARPLLAMEEMLEKLPESDLIPKLYETLKVSLGGRHDWYYYQGRMRALQAAESIANARDKDIAGDPLKFVKGKAKWEIVKTFLKAKYSEEWDELQAKRTSLQDYINLFQREPEVANELISFAKSFSVSYAPLFQFRSSLFGSLKIKDPIGLLLDEAEETQLDPIHLLRYYEFATRGDEIEITNRAEPAYQLNFRWRYVGSRQEFLNTQLNKLNALEHCQIERKRGDAIAPTPLIKRLETSLLPGVIICPITNAAAYYKLRKERIMSYPITVSGNDFEKEYAFLPGLAGILTVAMNNVKIRLMDEEDFWIA
jgi:CRISPR-associated endonuclease/helicase Cas3